MVVLSRFFVAIWLVHRNPTGGGVTKKAPPKRGPMKKDVWSRE